MNKKWSRSIGSLTPSQLYFCDAIWSTPDIKMETLYFAISSIQDLFYGVDV